MAEGELLDWELVHGSDTESTDSITSEKKSGSGSSVIDDGMMILSDHFSAGKLETLSDQSLDSSRVDHGSESLSRVELGFDDSGDGSVRSELGFYDSKIGTFGDCEVKVSDFEAVDREAVSESTDGVVVTHCEDGSLLESEDVEVGDGRGHVEEVVDREAVSESIDGTVVTHCEDGHLLESEDVEVDDGRRQSGVEEPIEDLSYLCSDSGGNELVCGDSGIVNGEDDVVVGESEAVEESGGNSVDVVAVDSSVVRSGDESKSRETVWWKMPFVLVKYYAFRIGPVWSVSMAAALMGFVLLGRRLYNMKKKAQRFHLKVAIDDKKVSRVMSQAARLNEAFTEVRRVPVIRPALPSPGAWPVLSLR